MIRLRPSTAQDLDRLFHIWQTAVRATHHFLSPDHADFYARMLREQYLPHTAFTVALSPLDEVMAFMGMDGDKIDSLFVDPLWHGQGVGRTLVDHAAVGRSHLLVDVNEQNEGGWAFYRRLGFRQIGRSALDPCGNPYPLIHLHRDRV